MNKHEKRKDEKGKNALRKNEQTSMSKQQMSRVKGSRQEDDNKSKESLGSIATGNPSINNSTLLTSHSKEKSSLTCMYSKISSIFGRFLFLQCKFFYNFNGNLFKLLLENLYTHKVRMKQKYTWPFT